MNWSSSNRRAELPPDWGARRDRRLRADAWRCRQILEDGSRCTALATEVDHAVHRDDHRHDSLQSLCKDHHAQKTAQEGVQGRQAKKDRAKLPPDAHPGFL